MKYLTKSFVVMLTGLFAGTWIGCEQGVETQSRTLTNGNQGGASQVGRVQDLSCSSINATVNYIDVLDELTVSLGGSVYFPEKGTINGTAQQDDCKVSSTHPVPDAMSLAGGSVAVETSLEGRLAKQITACFEPYGQSTTHQLTFVQIRFDNDATNSAGVRSNSSTEQCNETTLGTYEWISKVDLYLTGGFSGSSSVPKGIEFTIAKLWDDTYKTDPANTRRSSTTRTLSIGNKVTSQIQSFSGNILGFQGTYNRNGITSLGFVRSTESAAHFYHKNYLLAELVRMFANRDQTTATFYYLIHRHLNEIVSDFIHDGIDELDIADNDTYATYMTRLNRSLPEQIHTGDVWQNGVKLARTFTIPAGNLNDNLNQRKEIFYDEMLLQLWLRASEQERNTQWIVTCFDEYKKDGNGNFVLDSNGDKVGSGPGRPCTQDELGSSTSGFRLTVTSLAALKGLVDTITVTSCASLEGTNGASVDVYTNLGESSPGVWSRLNNDSGKNRFIGYMSNTLLRSRWEAKSLQYGSQVLWNTRNMRRTQSVIYEKNLTITRVASIMSSDSP